MKKNSPEQFNGVIIQLFFYSLQSLSVTPPIPKVSHLMVSQTLNFVNLSCSTNPCIIYLFLHDISFWSSFRYFKLYWTYLHYPFCNFWSFWEVLQLLLHSEIPHSWPFSEGIQSLYTKRHNLLVVILGLVSQVILVLAANNDIILYSLYRY